MNLQGLGKWLEQQLAGAAQGIGRPLPESRPAMMQQFPQMQYAQYAAPMGQQPQQPPINYVGPYSPQAYNAAQIMQQGGAGSPYTAPIINAGQAILSNQGNFGGPMNQGFQFNPQGQYTGGGGADAGLFNGQTQYGPSWRNTILPNY